jgi:5-methylcytosine-specific restriction enzyme B
MKYISRQSLVTALRNLAKFRETVNRQGAQHILPFLALTRKGANPATYVPFNESDDFQFFDEFCRVQGGDYPYFDPIASDFRIATHPHSNVATARKGTFSRSWHAGEFRSTAEGEEWILAPDSADTLRSKALTKQRTVTRIPALDLATFLFRKRAFDDSGSVRDVVAQLKRDFRIKNSDFDSLFDASVGAASPNYFIGTPLTDTDVLATIDESGVRIAARPDRAVAPERLPEPSAAGPDDPIIKRALQLIMEDHYPGVVLVGPPGTSKSWYALQIARYLVEGDSDRIFKVQFHRSYQYENFVEGFVPKLDGSGFELRDQLALVAAREAEANPDLRYVILIDELSRSDPGRVFGELLTYMEPTRRDEPFLLASGREISLPPKLYFIATMNSRDKSVVEIDDAFDRRLAKLPMDPDSRILEKFLDNNGIVAPLRPRLIGFFNWVNTTHYPLGQTFFLNIRDEEGLRRLWETQLRFVFQKAFPYEPTVVEQIRERYFGMFAREEPAPA